MTKLEEIRKRWARMSANRYALGRLEAGAKLELGTAKILKDVLIVYSDRPQPESLTGEKLTCVNAICGPLNDADTLEDAIAYVEAPTDIEFLLQLLNEASNSLEWALDQLEEMGCANMAADKTALRLKGREVSDAD